MQITRRQPDFPPNKLLWTFKRFSRGSKARLAEF